MAGGGMGPQGAQQYGGQQFGMPNFTAGRDLASHTAALWASGSRTTPGRPISRWRGRIPTGDPSRPRCHRCRSRIRASPARRFPRRLQLCSSTSRCRRSGRRRKDRLRDDDGAVAAVVADGWWCVKAVPIHDLPVVWPRVRPLLHRMADKIGTDGWMPEDVYAICAAGMPRCT